MQRPRVIVGGEAGMPRGVQRVQDLAVDVELELPGGAVADPDRPGVLVAGQPVQGQLGQAPLAVRRRT